MKTILIAKDSDDLRSMLKQLLEADGYIVLEAVTGQEAVEVAIIKRPGLVLMDLGLPGMDGLSAVTEIRDHIPVSEMPILIVSAYDRLEYRTEAVSAGVVPHSLRVNLSGCFWLRQPGGRSPRRPRSWRPARPPGCRGEAAR